MIGFERRSTGENQEGTSYQAGNPDFFHFRFIRNRNLHRNILLDLLQKGSMKKLI
jgi:hypothetical protein